MDTLIIIFLVICIVLVSGFLAKIAFFKHNKVTPLAELDRKNIYQLKPVKDNSSEFSNALAY